MLRLILKICSIMLQKNNLSYTFKAKINLSDIAFFFDSQ